MCPIYDYAVEGDLHYISMEYVDGVTLKDLIHESGGLPVAVALDIAVQIVTGLTAIHDIGIMNRDVKPSNLMRTRAGLIKLMDFGIAKQVGGVTLTAAGQAVGTPEYMSPELVTGQKLDLRTVAYDLRNAIHEKLVELSFSYHDRAETGQLLSRSIQDVERIRFLTGRALMQYVSDAVGTYRNGKDDFLPDRNYEWLDITLNHKVEEFFSKHKPKKVFIACANLFVDGCENPSSDAVNITGITRLIHCAKDALVVFFSSSYVFDGKSQTPYKPTDETFPIIATAGRRRRLTKSKNVRLGPKIKLRS